MILTNPIKVCDAIMGSGKSSAAITYINEHPEKHFIYIAPYKDQDDRIAQACPEAHFVIPAKLPQYNYSKVQQTEYLLGLGLNVASTHAAFKSYSPQIIESIQKYDYTLIIDEAVDAFLEEDFSPGDVRVLEQAGYIETDGDKFHRTDLEYSGEVFNEILEMMKCNNLVPTTSDKGKHKYYYWMVPTEVLKALNEVIVLTYLFDVQEFKYFLDMDGIPYRNIGVSYDGDTYRFADEPDYVPSYTRHLKEKIHIIRSPKLNAVGERKTAFSESWLKRYPEEHVRIKKNLINFYTNIAKAHVDDAMWSTYKNAHEKLSRRGYAGGYEVYNLKAKNDLRHKHVLAYCVNIFPSPQKVKFFAEHGITYDADGYALSTMIQWIWRSAIRDGQDIWLYLPSKRMRDLLEAWLDSFEPEGGGS